MGDLFVEPVQHVADVVQQRGGNRGGAGAGHFGGVGSLQAVFKNGDRLSEICAPSLGIEQIDQISIFAVVMVRTPSA